MIARYLFIAIVACLLLVLACENPDNPTFGPDHPNPNPGGTPAAIDPRTSALIDHADDNPNETTDARVGPARSAPGATIAGH